MMLNSFLRYWSSNKAIAVCVNAPQAILVFQRAHLALCLYRSLVPFYVINAGPRKPLTCSSFAAPAQVWVIDYPVAV